MPFEVKWKVKMKVTQSCPTLCDPMDSTVHGILQAKIMDWVAFPFPRGSSQPRDRTQVSRIEGGFFMSWATGEAQEYWSGLRIPSPADLPDPGIELGSLALHVDSLPTELLGKPNAIYISTKKKERKEIVRYKSNKISINILKPWTTWFKNWQKSWIDVSQKKIYRWQVSIWKRASTSYVIREVKIKTTVMYHYIPIRMVKL